jgi:Zn finger protein HypA/HybF involved in hydrogenase expression
MLNLAEQTLITEYLRVKTVYIITLRIGNLQRIVNKYLLFCVLACGIGSFVHLRPLGS